jgi:mTERF domain-containing protein
MVEPLKHIHAIPPVISLSSSRRLQSPTKLLSAFYSILRTPISPPPSFESTPVASFLLNECGFSLDEANSICRRKPDLLGHKSYDNARQTLHFLRYKGLNEISVRKLFSHNPAVLRFSFQSRVKPKVEFLERIGLTGQKLLKVLNRSLWFLNLNLSRTLEQKVCFLQSVLDPHLAALVSNPKSDKIAGKVVSNHSLTASVISQNSRLLSSPTVKVLEGFVKDVEGMGIEKGSKAFARCFVVLSVMNRDTVKRKLENLRELGFTEEEVGILVKRMPTLLWSSEDKLRQNLKFLVEEWKLPRNVLLSYPMALKMSTEKRLKPRLIALRDLRMKNKSTKEAESYPPVHYIRMSERDFHCKVASRLAK